MAAPNYKYRLKKNHGKLLADLEPKKVVNILYQEDVFDLDEMDEVRCEKPRKRQAEVLLDKVTRSGDTNIAIFVNALRQTQKHLYELLQMPVRGEQLQAEIEAQWRANSVSGNIGIGHITNQMAVMHSHQELPSCINKALSPSATEYPPQLGNTDKGAVFCQNSENHPPEDEVPPFVVPTDLSKLPPHIHPGSEFVYQMRSKPRGIALIINNEVFGDNPEATKKEKEQEELDVRHGSNEDVRKLETLFGALDFKVKTERNKGRKEILDILDEVSQDDHRSYDCFVLWLMSHGQEGQFYGADGETVPIETVRDFFSNAKCQTLRGKPKLIFIQACRGREKEKGVATDAPYSPTRQPSTHEELTGEEEESSDTGYNFQLSKTIPEHADILIANSTISGYASFRNPRDGSRFVRCIVEVFKEFAGHEDLLSMLTIVNERVGEMGEIATKQVSEPATTLRKKLFFWPGL